MRKKMTELNYEELITFTGLWYYKFYLEEANMFEFTMNQIQTYQNKAFERTLQWTK